MELILYDIRFILQTLFLDHQHDIFYSSQCTTSREYRYIIPKNDKKKTGQFAGPVPSMAVI